MSAMDTVFARAMGRLNAVYFPEQHQPTQFHQRSAPAEDKQPSAREEARRMRERRRGGGDAKPKAAETKPAEKKQAVARRGFCYGAPCAPCAPCAPECAAPWKKSIGGKRRAFAKATSRAYSGGTSITRTRSHQGSTCIGSSTSNKNSHAFSSGRAYGGSMARHDGYAYDMTRSHCDVRSEQCGYADAIAYADETTQAEEEAAPTYDEIEFDRSAPNEMCYNDYSGEEACDRECDAPACYYPYHRREECPACEADEEDCCDETPCPFAPCPYSDYAAWCSKQRSTNGERKRDIEAAEEKSEEEPVLSRKRSASRFKKMGDYRMRK